MDTPCEEYDGYIRRDGYGQVPRAKYGTRRAHIIAWIEANGPIPEGLYVCHHCDNPPCRKVEHLFLGTQAENLADMRAKGRHWFSSRDRCKNGHAFTEENTAWRERAGHGLARVCRRCSADGQRRYKARKKADR